jgi:hypothetical protein
MRESAWENFFVRSQLTRAVRIRMRLVQEDHEVRALEGGWEVTRVGNPPRLAISKQYTRGPDRTVSRRYTIRGGDSGGIEATETFRFDTLTCPLVCPACLTCVTPGVFSPARLARPLPHMADCRSCSVEC